MTTWEQLQNADLLTKTSVDVGVGAGSMTLATWSVILTSGFQWFAMIGGAVLLAFRLWLVIVELREKRRSKREEEEACSGSAKKVKGRR